MCCPPFIMMTLHRLSGNLMNFSGSPISSIFPDIFLPFNNSSPNSSSSSSYSFYSCILPATALAAANKVLVMI